MNPKDLFTRTDGTDGLSSDRDRAVSPVVGVALLIAIAVILATVIGVVVLGIGPGGANVPQAELIADYNTTASNNTLTVTHNGGDPVPVDEVRFLDESGNELALSTVHSDDQLTTGQSVTVTDTDLAGIGTEDDIRVVWSAPDSDKEIILAKFIA